MSHLVLIKHALPHIVPSVISSQWILSEQGRQQCYALAEKLQGYALERVVTSIEPKAQETGSILAQLLEASCEIGNGLQENDRTGFPFLDASGWKTVFRAFFSTPHEQVIGQETAQQAHQRFAQAVDSIVEKHADTNIAIVTHGTVLSLFVADANGIEPFSLWERLTCPSFVVLSLPDYRLQAVVDRIDSR